MADSSGLSNSHSRRQFTHELTKSNCQTIGLTSSGTPLHANLRSSPGGQSDAGLASQMTMVLTKVNPAAVVLSASQYLGELFSSTLCPYTALPIDTVLSAWAPRRR